MVLPPALVEEVVDAALAQEEEDGWVAEQVAAGYSATGSSRWMRGGERGSTRGGRADERDRGCAKHSQRAYQWLRTDRRPGVTPGYRLVLASIANDLDMSVVPVREAIRRLEAEGLVMVERNIGARVSMIDDSEYRHSMESLAILRERPRPWRSVT